VQHERLALTTSPELFELKVLVEAHGWHDVAALMASVDRALDPHHAAIQGERRWSVVANRLPAERADELLDFVDQLDGDEPATSHHDDVSRARARRTA
jgi:hypothetical protein